ncbi:assimilatory sulfite reductase (NADPH) flavoprotein subunit [Paraneptunicella aestuarii]|uniref:assimilatory sulfite reductase (NADPH) flavoprotein subunit n=1 Tax=Paraneptunicella aestuarii TaxID=2831148 RepID=UPI001E3F2FCA|nr:assimilatory sulfite reductase (NADPH) flavoprotein subunit [Paraneptunicella aestuarii]UAA39349.1 assimilatory sulfite reductase (NADPH) flavoprotein subunit [Paraneptunicella aestuarii]
MSSPTNNAVAPTAVLSEAQWQQLNQAASSLDGSQLIWASGYLYGLAQQSGASGAQVAAPVSQSSTSQSLTILYGSQTGNAKGVAEKYKQAAEAAGFSANVYNMADYKPKNLKGETHLLIVVSTHGEGDAPDDAVQLHEFVGSKKAPKLDGLKYAVIALGDTSYEFFCQTGKDFDTRLSALGAKPLAERLDCDVDYEDVIPAWTESLTEKLKEELKSGGSQVVAMPGVSLAGTTQPAESQYNKANPFTATLSASAKITGRDSVKDIRHIEISLEDSGIQYQPGDALGVWFINDEKIVDDIIKLTGNEADTKVETRAGELTLKEALLEKLELTMSYPGFVTAYAPFVKNAELDALVDDKAKLREYLEERQIVDVIREYPAQVPAQDLVKAMRPLTPRLYSIASSQAEVEDEVHLTVALVEYEKFGHLHQGGASGYLSKRLEEGQEVKVYVESNNNFRLPADPNTPVIMVGPGTGIAPFRSFLQQREAEEAEGQNWLFFGNPSFTQDFLYQVEIQKYVKDGVLNKVSLAFSRDQEEKIYVQHRMLENGAELYKWLEQGAHFYVCGDANRMAKDVNDALVSIVQQHGNKSQAEAEQYVNDLRRAKRYQKDVY